MVILAALTVLPIVVTPVLFKASAFSAVPEPTLLVNEIPAVPELMVNERAVIAFAMLDPKLMMLFVEDNTTSAPKLTALL